MKFSIPKQLETERLLLRMFQESDWDDLHQMFSDEECIRFTTKITLERWQTWRTLATYLGHWQIKGFGPYAVVEKESNKMIGPVGLWYPGEWPEPEIKWSLTRLYWGKGYATEAAKAVKEMAFKFLEKDRLISLILPGNEPSVKVAKRIGGELEKTIPFRDGKAQIYRYQPSDKF